MSVDKQWDDETSGVWGNVSTQNDSVGAFDPGTIGQSIEVHAQLVGTTRECVLMSADGRVIYPVDSKAHITQSLERRAQILTPFMEEGDVHGGYVEIYVRVANSSIGTYNRKGGLKGEIYRYVVNMSYLLEHDLYYLKRAGMFVVEKNRARSISDLLQNKIKACIERTTVVDGRGIFAPYALMATSNAPLPDFGYTWTGNEIIKSPIFGNLGDLATSYAYTDEQHHMASMRVVIDKNDGLKTVVELSGNHSVAEIKENNGVFVWDDNPNIVSAISIEALTDYLTKNHISVSSRVNNKPCDIPGESTILEIQKRESARVEGELQHKISILNDLVKARDVAIKTRDATIAEQKREIEKFHSGEAQAEKKKDRQEAERIAKAKHRVEMLKTIGTFLTVAVTAYGIFKDPIASLFKWIMGKTQPPSTDALWGL